MERTKETVPHRPLDLFSERLYNFELCHREHVPAEREQKRNRVCSGRKGVTESHLAPIRFLVGRRTGKSVLTGASFFFPLLQ